jgi:hypothetical protein
VRLGTSERGDHTELRCGHLALELVELPDATRSVRTATARGGAGGGGDDVVFVNQRLRRGGAEGHVASRLRLAGPVLTFDNALQQVQVLGPGSLLVEDYRPTARVPAASASDDDPAAMVALRGRGVTLLTWTSQMTLDAYHNDMRAAGDVVMDHMPVAVAASGDGAPPGVHLNCQRLVADLEATDGLPGWLSDHPPQPEIRGLYADRQVRVIAGGRTYLADRMTYTGGDQIVVLRGELGGRGLTEIQEADGRNLTARLLRWNLRDNTYEMVQPGPTRVPVR